MHVEIDERFLEHQKTLRLCGALRNPQAGMIVIRLWTWALRAAPAGALRGIAANEIEAAVQYQPRDGACYAALVTAGFIEESAPCCPEIIVDWTTQDGPIRLHVPRSGGGAYGADWPEIRAAIILRDGARCGSLGCGSTTGLEVHHRRPMRLFDGDVYAAHAPSNLVTLCRRCHVQAEVEFRRLEREGQVS